MVFAQTDMKSRLFLGLIPFAVIVPSRGAELEVISLARLADGRIRVVVEDAAAASNEYRFLFSDDPAGPWGEPAGVAVNDLSAGRVQLTAPATSAVRQFFRVVGLSGTADDPDGDGLASSFEDGQTGTDPFAFDTDADGFGDGIEFALGTDPNDAADFPSRSSLPSVEFVELVSAAAEGGGTQAIELAISPPFTGTVQYAVHSSSTALEGADFLALSGSVSVSGGSASIPITPVDNAQIDAARTVVIDLLPGAGYRTGGASRHVVRLEENDACWSGSLGADFQQRDLCVELIRSPAGTTATFVTEGGAVDVEGLIPAGRHPATVTADTPGEFGLILNMAGQPVSSQLFGSGLAVTRSLTFSADPPTPGHLISEIQIAGTWTEELSSSKLPSGVAQSGRFVLIRTPAAP